MFFCEPAIDAMSLCAITNEPGIYISMAGNKDITFDHMVKSIGGTPIICSDADTAGRNFAAKYPQYQFLNVETVAGKGFGKDWNDMLQKLTELGHGADLEAQLKKTVEAFAAKKAESVPEGTLEGETFSMQVDAVLNGADTTSSHLMVMQTPELLQKAGLPNLPILITAKHLKNIIAVRGTDNVNYHGVDVNIVKNLPTYLSNPIIVADSLTRTDSIVVITEALDSTNNPIIAAIMLNGNGRINRNYVEANILTSAYGKDNFQSFINNIAKNNAIIYWDKQKSQRLSVNLGVQFPDDITSLSSNIIIRQTTAKVNTSEQKILKDEIKILPKEETVEAYAAKKAESVPEGTLEGKASPYSIEYTIDNQPVVIIRENILENIPQDQWIKTVREALGRFSKGIPISGKTIRVNKNSKDEFTFSKNTRYYEKHDISMLETKFKTAGSIDGIIYASTNYINEALEHPRKDNIKDFARGEVLLRIGNNDYHAQVLIGLTGGNNLVFHDIVDFSDASLKLKREKVPSAAMHKQEATEYDTLSVNNIPQTPENVNISEQKILKDEIKILPKEETVEAFAAKKAESVPEGTLEGENIGLNTRDFIQHSIVEPFIDDHGNLFENSVLLNTSLFDDVPPRDWGKELNRFIFDRASKNPIIIPITDEKGEITLLQFASPKDKAKKQNGVMHNVLSELSYTQDNISKLAVVHIDEIASISEENTPYYTPESTHGWLDENGWLHRNANVINSRNGNIYNLTFDIAKAADGRTILFTTKGKIMKVGHAEVNSLKLKGSGQHSNLNDSIPQAPENVNISEQKILKDEIKILPKEETVAETKRIDGITYSADGKTLIKADPMLVKGEIIIPEGVTSIGDNAFSGCKGLTNISCSRIS